MPAGMPRRRARSGKRSNIMTYSYKVLPIDQVKPHPRNAHTHSKKQIRQISASIRDICFGAPVLVDEHNVLIAGHGRLEAAKSLKMPSIPAIVISGLSDAKKRALLLADNRIALSAGWNRELLAIELAALPDLLVEDDLDISVTGFEPAEIDALHADFEDRSNDPADEIDNSCLDGPAVTEFGDLWQLGKHRLLCGDARSSDDLTRLLDGKRAHMAFLDPPYNVAVSSVVGRGAVKHAEFAMASGEMSRDAFIAFLKETLGAAAKVSIDGAIPFACMDWRHIEELVTASRSLYGAMLNLIAWVKTNPGQGSFYRSQHELIGVFRVGATPHLNTVELGRHGRSRSNVWHYSGANTFRAGRMDDLRAHPTVKPVAMIADGMKDCTHRNDIVLDTFCGSGTTILAAERVGRRGCGLEIDPGYVDVAVRRWQAFSGRDALHVASGLTFEEIGLQHRGKKKANRASAVDKRGRR
jgi:DNA modification methylase